jgi:hypothetical protein
MKRFLILISLLISCVFSSLSAVAEEAKIGRCEAKATEVASAIFDAIHETSGKRPVSVQLVYVDQSENGAETWDVNFEARAGELIPYRMTMLNQDCLAIGFVMPTLW